MYSTPNCWPIMHPPLPLAPDTAPVVVVRTLRVVVVYTLPSRSYPARTNQRGQYPEQTGKPPIFHIYVRPAPIAFVLSYNQLLSRTESHVSIHTLPLYIVLLCIRLS